MAVDKDCAYIVVASCVRAAGELGSAAALIGDETSELYGNIARIVYDIMQDVVEKIHQDMPDLKLENENRLEKYGRIS